MARAVRQAATSSVRAKRPAVTLTREEAKAWLLSHLGLQRREEARGARGVRAVLDRLRCIQLDPLDPLGTNADLVALARVDGIGRGDVYRHLMPGHAFEHFAKERCLIPASAFPHYRERAAQTPWWRLGERLERLPPRVLDAVLEEVEARGPCTADALVDHGRVEPLDWDGWKGTGRATAMALDVLWTRCQVVVCGRGPLGKVYDVPLRALPDHAAAAAVEDFARWSLLERVESAGLLRRASSAVWSTLQAVRASDLPERLVDEGLLEEVVIEGGPHRFLAPAGFRDRPRARGDDALRILGPLDPLLWDRELVERAFGFEYVWEVYKPAKLRRWGWYVLPLLHRGEFVGRLEGRIGDGALRIDRLWPEPDRGLDDAALDEALARHAEACGVDRVVRPPARPTRARQARAPA